MQKNVLIYSFNIKSTISFSVFTNFRYKFKSSYLKCGILIDSIMICTEINFIQISFLFQEST